MENNFDTIVSIITPIARSAVGIIRLSGSKSFEIAQAVFSKPIKSRVINYGYILEGDKMIDEVILLPFNNPHSYTGEDVIEIQTHGNPTILNYILDLLISNGARQAQRGEFTKRAFLNGRIDMTQAEAVADIIDSRSFKSVSNALNNLCGYLKNEITDIKADLINLYSKLIASIDFPEDVNEVENSYIEAICNDNITKINTIIKNTKNHDYIRDGISVALIGKPNVGKSSLFNSLLNYNRAIVTEIAGTTRDSIREVLNLDGYLVNFIDTAGIRDKNSVDLVEKLGINNSIESIKQSEIILFLFEKGADEIDSNLIELAQNKHQIFVKTKCDINANTVDNAINISSLTGFGIEELKNRIIDIIKDIVPDNSNYTTTKRQKACLIKAQSMLNSVIQTIRTNALADLCATDLKGAILALDEITGEVLTDDILNNIFDNFCIGK